MRGQLVPTVVGSLLCYGLIAAWPTAGHADSALHCVNSDTMSDISENLRDTEPKRSPLDRDPLLHNIRRPRVVKTHADLLSLKITADGHVGLRVMDVPEPAIGHSVERVIDCLIDH